MPRPDMQAASPHPDWIVPAWPAPANVQALCTTRQGGVSLSPYDSLNLGLHVADDAAHVYTNRQRLADAVSGRPVFLNQVHGSHCLPLSASTADGAVADACAATAPGVVCTIMVADCLPVLLAAADGSQVAAAHAGWRGLVGEAGHGVLDATMESFRPLAPVKYARAAPEIIAWLGPCIGPDAFEVGAEVRDAFMAALPAAAECFKPLAGGKWLANLPALARQRLQAAGVHSIWGNDGSAAWCTVSNPLRFFSHRRDRVSGRQAACIWLE